VYKKFFGLTDNPFNIVPDPHYLFSTSETEEAFAKLLFGIQSHKGLILLSGEVGTGKTILLKKLVDTLHGQSAATAFVFNPQLNPAEFFDYMLSDFGIAHNTSEKPRMMRILYQWLLERQRVLQTSVLIVDEAHDLSNEVLEEIRLLSNMETPSDKLLQIILSGQPEIEEKLARPELRRFRQRIALRHRTHAFSLAETSRYIAHRVRVAGGNPSQVFSSEAMTSAFEHSQGIPRIINLLCEHALISAYADQEKPVAAGRVEEAADQFGLCTFASPVKLPHDKALEGLEPASLSQVLVESAKAAGLAIPAPAQPLAPQRDAIMKSEELPAGPQKQEQTVSSDRQTGSESPAPVEAAERGIPLVVPILEPPVADNHNPSRVTTPPDSPFSSHQEYTRASEMRTTSAIRAEPAKMGTRKSPSRVTASQSPISEAPPSRVVRVPERVKNRFPSPPTASRAKPRTPAHSSSTRQRGPMPTPAGFGPRGADPDRGPDPEERPSNYLWAAAVVVTIGLVILGYFALRPNAHLSSRQRQANSLEDTAEAKSPASFPAPPMNPETSTAGAASQQPAATEPTSPAPDQSPGGKKTVQPEAPRARPPASPLSSPPKAVREASRQSQPQTPRPAATREEPPRTPSPVGRMLVTSDVPGATVSLDGRTEPDWKTPHTFVNLEPGFHVVSLSRQGYRQTDHRVSVEAGKLMIVEATLASTSGELVITTNPPGADVFIDGRAYGPSPVRAQVAPGEHAFSARLAGREPAEGTATVNDQAVVARELVLPLPAPQPPPPPALNVSVSTDPPKATVYADGAPKGSTPVSFHMTPGQHTLIIFASGFRPVRREIEVSESAVTTVHETLTSN
jgi:general secretion pathway protein A